MVMCVQMVLKSRQLSSVTWHVLQNLRQYERNLPSENIYKIRNFCSAASKAAVQRRFTDKHEWILCEGSIGTVGVTHHAQDSLGEVVYAQLPDIGTSIGKEEECGALESVKAASEIYCPVSGKVVEKNEQVETAPSLINKSCYEKGWLFKLELTNPGELSKLMSEEEYEKYIKTERR